MTKEELKSIEGWKDCKYYEKKVPLLDRLKQRLGLIRVVATP
jgi:hypothetical protein